MRRVVFLVGLLILVVIGAVPAQSNWGPWQEVPCLRGLDYRYHHTERSDGSHYWNFQFRNRYHDIVHFTFDIESDPDVLTLDFGAEGRMSLRPGQTGRSWAITEAGKFYISVGRVRFGASDVGSYASCDK